MSTFPARGPVSVRDIHTMTEEQMKKIPGCWIEPVVSDARPEKPKKEGK